MSNEPIKKPRKPEHPMTPYLNEWTPPEKLVQVVRSKNLPILWNHTYGRSELEVSVLMEELAKLPPIATPRIVIPSGVVCAKLEWSVTETNPDYEEQQAQYLRRVADQQQAKADYEAEMVEYEKAMERYKEDLATYNRQQLEKRLAKVAARTPAVKL